jgi:hypothetical protein
MITMSRGVPGVAFLPMPSMNRLSWLLSDLAAGGADTLRPKCATRPTLRPR